MRFVMSVEKDGFVELFIASQLALKLWLVMINLIIEVAIKIVNRKVSDEKPDDSSTALRS